MDDVITSTAQKHLPDFARTVKFLSANSYDIQQMTVHRGKYNTSQQSAVQKQSAASTVSAFLMQSGDTWPRNAREHGNDRKLVSARTRSASVVAHIYHPTICARPCTRVLGQDELSEAS